MLNNLFKRDGSSDVDMPNALLNFVLKKIFGLEKYLLRFINLPFGVSILAVVKKMMSYFYFAVTKEQRL